MTDPYVREIGRVEDIDGGGLVVGVYYNTVTVRGSGQIGHPARLTQAQAEEFAQLFVSAVWQAGQQQALRQAERSSWPDGPLMPGEAVVPRPGQAGSPQSVTPQEGTR